MAPIKILASQAQSISLYKDVRTKVMKCCANIYFNQQCLIKKVIPKYANIKITYTSPATNVTQKKRHTIWLKDEIKFLYKKKEKLNKDLYNIHLKAAQEWRNTWNIILDSIHKLINEELEKKYKTTDIKLKKLVKTQMENPDYQGHLYPWVINKTDITFTDDELSLLNNGLKCNLNYKHKNWIKPLP